MTQILMLMVALQVALVQPLAGRAVRDVEL
jgi:hypothetical protein